MVEKRRNFIQVAGLGFAGLAFSLSSVNLFSRKVDLSGLPTDLVAFLKEHTSPLKYNSYQNNLKAQLASNSKMFESLKQGEMLKKWKVYADGNKLTFTHKKTSLDLNLV